MVVPTGVKRDSGGWSVFDSVRQLVKPRGDKTHMCIHCGTFLTLTLNKNKGSSFKNTKAIAHMKSKHPDILNDKETNLEQRQRKVERQLRKQRSLLSSWRTGDTQRRADADSALTACLVAQHRFYLFARQRISKATLSDETFRNVVRTAFEAGAAAATAQPPTISTRSLFDWVTAELDNFRWGVRRYVRELMEKSRGLPFAQGQHDCVTLKSTDSYLASGLQFVDVESKRNITLCMGFERVVKKKSRAMATTLDRMCQHLTGRTYSELAYATIADHAALTVAQEFGHEKCGCDMHAISKISESAVGDLTRSRNREVVNPFDECDALLKKAHKMAKYFRFQARRSKLFSLATNVQGGFAKIRPQLKLNGTRISARLNEVYSVLRLWKGLKAYVFALLTLFLVWILLFDVCHDVFEFSVCVVCLFFPYAFRFAGVQSKPPSWTLTMAEWQQLAEVEAVMRIVQFYTTAVQHEKVPMAALGHELRTRLLRELRADAISVIDLPNVTDSPIVPRVKKPVAEWSALGKRCLRRAKLEAERRFCGNKALDEGTEEDNQLNDAVPALTDMQGAAMLLDPRTIPLASALVLWFCCLFVWCLCARADRSEYCYAHGVARLWCLDAPEKWSAREVRRHMATLRQQYVLFATANQETCGTAAGDDDGDDDDDDGDDDSDDDREPFSALLAALSTEGAKNAEQLAAEEFDTVFSRWVKTCSTLNWNRVDTNDEDDPFRVGADFERGDPVKHLLRAPVYKAIAQFANSGLFGHLPALATHSSVSIGPLLSQSFCERVNSAANIVMGDHNTMLSPAEVSAVVLLRMNKEFAEMLRDRYKDVPMREKLREMQEMAKEVLQIS